MSEIIINMGSNHGISAGKYYQVGGPVMDQGEIEIMEDVKKSVTSMTRSQKIIFSLAIATMAVDALFLSGGTASAAASAGFDITKVHAAFDPVKEFLIAIADPICYVMFVWGCIECIVGRAASGLNRIKYAAIGYIAINWIPVVMDIIREAGAAGRGV